MKYVYVPVYSGRSHPEKNIRISSEEELRNWYLKEVENNDLTYFVSFTDLDKVSLNPNFSYKNVIGVYTYPLRLIYKRQMLDADFATSRKYLQILKINASKSNILSSENYSEPDYYRDVQKLKFIFNKYKYFFDVDKIRERREELNSFVSFELDYISSFDKLLTLVDDNNRNLETIAYTINHRHNARLKRNSYFRKIWILSMFISILLTKKNYVVTWNNLLRKLGYKVVIDSNTGTVHPKEPKQAVFLSKDSYSLVSTIENNLLPVYTFLSFLHKKKIAFSEESDNDIIVSGDIEIKRLKLTSLPHSLEVNGELNIEQSSLLSEIFQLKAKSILLNNSYFNKFPTFFEVKDAIFNQQKVQALSQHSKIEAILLYKSKINVIKSGAKIDLLILKESNIKKIEEGAIIKRVVMDDISKLQKYPEYLKDIISHNLLKFKKYAGFE